MSGLIFLKTEKLDVIREFYIGRIGMELWLDQGQCIILRHDNFLLGFCQGDKEAVSPCITFFYETNRIVDEMYLELKDISLTEPVENKNYNIYHFWAKDPEGRTLEFQRFLNEGLRL